MRGKPSEAGFQSGMFPRGPRSQAVFWFEMSLPTPRGAVPRSPTMTSLQDVLRFASGGPQRWARPEEPMLNTLPDEKAQPEVFFHNSNFRTSRKYINIEKVKVRSCGRAGPRR
jgi:hypothetical protein